MINVNENVNKYPCDLKVAKKVDVVVVGGGPAGVAAAIAAGRNGANTLLIERGGSLGGNMTTAGAGGISLNGFRSGINGHPIVIEGIALEIFKKLQERGGAMEGELIYPRQVYDPDIMVHVLDEMTTDAGVDVLLNTVAFDALVENDTVKGIAIANKSGGQIILADRFIDTTADGDIAFYSGAKCVVGREQDEKCQGGALDMLIAGIDTDRFIDFLKNDPVLSEEERRQLDKDRSELLGAGRPLDTVLDGNGNPYQVPTTVKATDWNEVERVRAEGKKPLPINYCCVGGGPNPGKSTAPIVDGKYLPLPGGLDKLWIEFIKEGKAIPLYGSDAKMYPAPRFEPLGVFRHGKRRYDMMYSGVYESWFDATSEEETSKAIIYMRKMNQVYIDFLREKVPGFENAYIVLEASTCGTRESRRIVGEYALTEDDLWEGRKFDDVIAMGGTRGPDSHVVGGIWGTGIVTHLTKTYDIPYRCLVPIRIENLIVAGRCISGRYMASGAVRSMVPAMATGQAAGTAAVLSLNSGKPFRSIDVKQLQDTIVSQGALLKLKTQ